MRNVTLDVMRGIGILLIGIEHSYVKNTDILTTQDDWLFFLLKYIISPLFFIVSGYIVYNKITRHKWLSTHVIKWLSPIAIFAVIYWVFAQFFPNLIHFYGYYDVDFLTYIVFIYTNGFASLVLWFLYTFILCYFVTWILEQSRLKFNKVPLPITFICIVVILNSIPTEMFGLFALKWYSIYFMGGYLLHHYEQTKFINAGKKLAYGSIILFPLVMWLLNCMIPYQKEYVSFGLAFPMMAINNGEGLYLLLSFAVSCLGVLFIYSISKLIKWLPQKVFVYLGKITVGMFLIRVLFIGMFDNLWLSFGVATVISIVIYELLKRVKVLNKYLFGG